MQPSFLVVFAMMVSPAMCTIAKVHHHHHMKFREVEVIADGATCPNSGAVLMCQSASNECQDDGTGAQKCLPRDKSFLDSIDNTTTMPWAECSTSNPALPSNCLFATNCLCVDYANIDCYCMPFDAWRVERKVAENCTTTDGQVGVCDAGKYCRTKGKYQECAPAPYLPGQTSLYSDCSGDGKCDTGLACKQFSKFMMCVDEKSATA